MRYDTLPPDPEREALARELRELDLTSFRSSIEAISDNNKLGYLRYELGYDQDPSKSSWQVKEINRLITRRKEERRSKLEELERNYAFMEMALKKGGTAVVLALVLSFVVLAVAVLSLIYLDKPFLNGTQFIILVAILVGALVVYFSFVFGRSAKLSAEIATSKVEISSGE